MAPFPPWWALPQVLPHGARPPQGSEGRQEMAAAPFPPPSSLRSPRSLRRPAGRPGGAEAAAKMAGIGHFPAAFSPGTTSGRREKARPQLCLPCHFGVMVPSRLHRAEVMCGASPVGMAAPQTLLIYISRCARRLGHCSAAG